MTSIDYELDDAAEAITNAYYLSVQEQIGQQDGGPASMFESGDEFKDEFARPIVRQLIGSERSEETFAKIDRIFDYKFITSQIEKKWEHALHVDLDSGEDLKTISKTTAEVLNKAIQKEFPDYPGLTSEQEISLSRLTKKYVEFEKCFDAPDEDDEPAAPGM